MKLLENLFEKVELSDIVIRKEERDISCDSSYISKNNLLFDKKESNEFIIYLIDYEIRMKSCRKIFKLYENGRYA